MMEHGYDQAASVRALLAGAGFDAVASARIWQGSSGSAMGAGALLDVSPVQA
jgi:hypothetical protein